MTIATPSASFGTAGSLSNAIVITGTDDDSVPGLRLVGKVTKTSQKEPNTAELTVYNLAPQTRAQMQTKGVRVILEAGYVSTGLTQLFLGDARTIDHVRDGADWRTVIKLGDGERSFRFARASESFAGPCTVGQVVSYCADKMGLSMGNVSAKATLLDKQLAHGWTVHGAASSEIDRVLRSVGYSYSIQDGALQVLAPGESIQNAIPRLDVDSGLIGSPEQGTPEKNGKPTSLKFKSLLLPQARPGGRVYLVSLRYKGVFRLRKVEHAFDTMGGDWYTTMEGVLDPLAKVPT